MKRLKGPELKMPELSVPPFLADLFYDLRDRRLLPLVALVVVAIAAVPFLLGSSGEPVSPPPPTEAATATGSGAANAATIAVVQAKPGLRDYRKRLADRSPADPFKQHYTAPSLAGAELPDAESSSGSNSPTTFTTGGSNETGGETTNTTTGSGGAPPSSPPPSGGGGGTHGARLFEFVIDVQISHTETSADGKVEMSEPEVRHRVRQLTQLPGEKTPVVTTGGVNLRNGKVVFLVSDDVKSLDGEFACLARTPTGICELLEVEPGFSFELVYGPNNVRYRLKVTKIDAVWAGRVGAGSRSPRAALDGPSTSPPPAP
jgi:hypothetical protein